MNYLQQIVKLLQVLLLVGIFFLVNGHAASQEQQEMLPVKFYMPDIFAQSLKQVQPKAKTSQIYAALVPHHLIAGNLIANIFEQLRHQGIERIIVVGPNHYEAGNFQVQQSSLSWQTPFGKVKGFALPTEFPKTEPNVLANEHSIAGLMPYVAYYLPKAQVFSVILKYKTPDSIVSELAETITSSINETTLLLVSVDFSHYLPYETAQLRDELTRRILVTLEEQGLYSLNNDYLDSPASLALLIKVCKKLNTQAFTIAEHSNSAVLLNNLPITSTTSYFTGYCKEH